MSKKAKLKAVDKATDKVKLSDLMRNEFQLALNVLMNGNLPIKTSYALLKVFDSVVEHQKYFEDIRLKLLDKYGKKDEAGKLLTNEAKSEYVLTDRPAFDKEYGDLLSLEVDISKIPLSYLAEAKLSPAMLSTLVKTVVSPEL